MMKLSQMRAAVKNMSYDYDKDTEQNIDKADKEKVSDDETDNIEVIVEGQSEEEMYWIDLHFLFFHLWCTLNNFSH